MEKVRFSPQPRATGKVVEWAAFVEVSLSMILMGSSVVVSKLITQSFPTALASELRLLLSAALQFILIRFTGGQVEAPSRRDWGILTLQAFLGVFLYSIFFMEGLRRTTALESSIICSFIPAAGAVISVVIFREKLDRKRYMGIALTVAGTVAANAAGGLMHGANALQHLTGNFLILLSAFCQAIFVTFGKLVCRRIHPFQIGAIVSALGAAMFLPMALNDLRGFNLQAVKWTQWGLILYIGLACTGFGVLMMNCGSRRISPSAVSALTALNPVGAIALSCLMLREPFSLWYLIGMLVIASGVFLVMRPDSGAVDRSV